MIDIAYQVVDAAITVAQVVGENLAVAVDDKKAAANRAVREATDARLSRSSQLNNACRIDSQITHISVKFITD